MDRTVVWERLKAFVRRAAHHAAEVVLLVSVYLLYMFVRKYLISDIEPGSFDNAIRMIEFEASGHFLWEARWQGWLLDHAHGVLIMFNYMYIITFWPIIVLTALVLYFKKRGTYFYLRHAFLLSYVFALIIFAAFPLAPPRFLPEYGFVDSIQHFGPRWYGGREMAAFYNAYAAMPSLHFGWTFFFGMYFLTVKNRWIKMFGILYPTITFGAIVLTANHFIMDAVGGAVVIISSFLLYLGLRWLGGRTSWALQPARGQLVRAGSSVQGSLARWKDGLSTPAASRSNPDGDNYLGKKSRRFSLQTLSVRARRT